MRSFYILILLCCLGAGLRAQSIAVPRGCYEEYQQLFMERGAKSIPDGMYKCVVAMRGQGGSLCLVGKIAVKDGKVQRPLYIQREDSTYVIPAGGLSDKPGDLSPNADLSIYNGVTKDLLTEGLNTATLFFTDFLGPRSNTYKRAPAASFYRTEAAAPKAPAPKPKPKPKTRRH